MEYFFVDIFGNKVLAPLHVCDKIHLFFYSFLKALFYELRGCLIGTKINSVTINNAEINNVEINKIEINNARIIFYQVFESLLPT